MADLREWAKGITFFIFVSLLFYFFWENIFSNIISFLGNDMFGIGSEASTSLTILKTMGWVSFVFLWLSTSIIYMIFAITAGSRNEVKTRPLELLKGIGVWVVLMPVLSFLYGLVHFMVTALNDSNIIDAGLETTATQFSWVMGIIILVATIGFPFYFVLRGYGVDIGKKEGGK